MRCAVMNSRPKSILVSIATLLSEFISFSQMSKCVDLVSLLQNHAVKGFPILFCIICSTTSSTVSQSMLSASDAATPDDRH